MCYDFISCDVVVIVASVSLPYTFLHLKLSTSPSRSSGAHGRSHHCLQQNLKCGMRFGLEYIMACWLLRSPECGARQVHCGMPLLMRRAAQPESILAAARGKRIHCILARLTCSPTRASRREASASLHSVGQASASLPSGAAQHKSIVAAARGKRISALC